MREGQFSGSQNIVCLCALHCIQWMNTFLKCLQLQTLFSTAHAVMPLALCLSPPYCGCSVPSMTSALHHHPLNSSWVHSVLCFSSLHFSTFMLHFCCCQCWEAPKLSAKSFPSLYSSWFPQARLNVSLLVLGKALFCRWSGTHSISLLFSFSCCSLSISLSEFQIPMST